MATYLEYLRAAMTHAAYERVEDGRYFASIPNFEGLWAVGSSRDDAANELYEALDNWLDVHVKIGRQMPPEIDGVNLSIAPKLMEG